MIATREHAEACATYIAARTEYERVGDLADAAFARYFSKRQAGEPTNGAACARLDNRASYLSAAVSSAEYGVWTTSDDEVDPETVWAAHVAAKARL